MAKSSRQEHKEPPKTKKHLARIEREQMQTRWIMIGAGVVLILVIGIIAYGILEQNVLKGMRSVATINGEKISADEFRAFTKYYRYTLISEAQRAFEISQIFGNNPTTGATIEEELQNISANLQTFVAGEAALDQLVQDRLIRQEAASKGITVNPEEIEKRLQEEFRYFEDGAPTPTATIEPKPTSTLSPLQKTMMPPTPTVAATSTQTSTLDIQADGTPAASPSPAPTEVLTPTATATITPIPTEYTFEAYQEQYATAVANIEDNYEVTAETLRYVIASDLIREKIIEDKFGDTPCSESQVWAQHILVEDEGLAKDINNRLKEGEDWQVMASTFSIDESNKDQSGDLGWFGKGRMVPEFEEVAFSLEIGEISQPVQTQFGYHIIRLLGKEDRPLLGAECQQLKSRLFQEWLEAFTEESDVQILEFWREVVPIHPLLPEELLNLIGQAPGGVPPGFPTTP